MSYKLVVKDALRQIIGRVLSAGGGFVVVMLMTPYLGPLRYGDYTTILKYFAIWSALADFGLYVLALKKLGQIKSKQEEKTKQELKKANSELTTYYSKFVTSRLVMIGIVYSVALAIAYLIPSYFYNPYIFWGLLGGVIFSGSFMAAGIVQLPLQLFWKMEQVSISLVLARIVQIAILGVTVLLYPKMSFAGGIVPLPIFTVMVFSVVASGLTQLLFVWFRGKKYIPFKWILDRSFTRKQMSSNRKYGFAYYLSSFHTLIVLIILSIFFPTLLNYKYVGLRGIALSLIEILLIIPSALGNSIMQKVTNYSHAQKMKSYGNLMLLIVWIAICAAINFFIFNQNIIFQIAGESYMTGYIGTYGADFILPFLGIVLILSFIKQIFNYIFVSADLQNKLWSINLVGVTIGTSIGFYLIQHYNIVGGIITQLLLEILFVMGSLFVARKHKLLPQISSQKILYLLGLSIMFAFGGNYIINTLFAIPYYEKLSFIAAAIALNGILFGVSFKWLKSVTKGLTVEDVASSENLSS
ncbi:MAG TPA: oligosaccharide flippase family protein [Candidatus Absconditabacterales bacterium]|nr:oligosaccharide flippase family protein [Candidatus Absconditabacterales bacterium]